MTRTLYRCHDCDGGYYPMSELDWSDVLFPCCPECGSGYLLEFEEDTREQEGDYHRKDASP